MKKDQGKIIKEKVMNLYYVSSEEEHASDDNDGTEQKPFATISHAIDMIGDDPNGVIILICKKDEEVKLYDRDINIK